MASSCVFFLCFQPVSTEEARHESAFGSITIPQNHVREVIFWLKALHCFRNGPEVETEGKKGGRERLQLMVVIRRVTANLQPYFLNTFDQGS